MPTIVPSGRGGAGLGDLLPSALAALSGEPDALGLAGRASVLVALVDGLGAEALAERSGHARTLSAAMTRRARIDTGCPTTTAAALATLATGTDPGVHGVVSYSALDPAADRVVNQLRGFDSSLPAGWQRSRTVFERAVEAGFGAFAVGPRHYATSGFTRQVLRGAEYVGARTVDDRFDAALAAVRPRPGIAYVYVPELDVTAHREGWTSSAWTAGLEAVDAAVAAAARSLRPGETLLVTADHGILDVPQDRHVLLGEVPGLLDGVRHVAGEPRLLHLHLQPGEDAAAVALRFSDALGAAAEVVVRDGAIAAGWFGAAVDPAVAPRIGDVLVAARGRVAFYADAADTGRGMVGQHGSWTDAERIVPLLRFDG